MVGRPLRTMYVRTRKPDQELVLEVENLTVPGKVKGVSLTAHKGEVVGLTGLMGAGQHDVLRALFGALSATGGTIRLRGREVVIRSPWDAIRNGIGLVTENRKEEGLVLPLSVMRCV